MGGGAMRAAARMAGLTAAGGGVLGITAEHYSPARKAASAHPFAATTEEMKLVAENSEQRKFMEIEDWVLTDAAEEADVDRMPRVVFGGSPTLQEAKEATYELAAALENAYLSAPNSVGNDGTVSEDNVSETKPCITTQLAVASSVPAPAIMAFKFLHESPLAKNVVASIACDQNVWNAVLKNEDLQQFLQLHTPCGPPTGMNTMAEFKYDGAEQYSTMASVGDCDPKSFSHSSKHAEYEDASGFVDILQKMQSSVIDMVSNMSSYLQNLFGVKGGNEMVVNGEGTTRSADTIMQASFMGLAVMAILVILLKRTEVN